MGRYKKIGLFRGTTGSGQMSFENYEYIAKVNELEENLQNIKIKQPEIISDAKKYGVEDLEKAGVKFNKEDVVFVTKDKTGQLLWLEKGNSKTGLEHILNGNGRSPGHAKDFEKAFGVQKENVANYINHIISTGNIISNTKKLVGLREGFERIYSCDGNYYLLTGIGTNGFIVSAYPIKIGGK